MLRDKSTQLSFYGSHIYERVSPKDHFDEAVDFSFVNELCRDAYTPDFGRSAYEPEVMFKILFLRFLYDVSDRRIEEEVNQLAFKWFVWLTIDELPIPPVLPVSGIDNDGEEFPRVVNSKANTVTADKAYDSKKNHRLLKRKKGTSSKGIGRAAT